MRPFVELVNPKLLLRIGLRYGDLIKIADGEKLEEYVDPYFDYPKLAKPLGTPEYQRDEVGIKTDVGRLLIRSIYGNTNLVSLPDIQGIPGLQQPEKKRRIESFSILITFGRLKKSLSSLTSSALRIFSPGCTKLPVMRFGG